MKIRRRVIVVGLVGALLATSATPAQAINGDVNRWRFVHISAVVMYVYFTVVTSYQPYDLATRGGDPALQECSENRPAKLQYKKPSGWDTIASGKTNDNARFKEEVKHRNGKYRALLPEFETESGYECFKAISDPKSHQY